MVKKDNKGDTMNDLMKITSLRVGEGFEAEVEGDTIAGRIVKTEREGYVEIETLEEYGPETSDLRNDVMVRYSPSAARF